MLEDGFRIDELELFELMELRRHQSPGNDVGGCWWLLVVVGCCWWLDVFQSLLGLLNLC